VPRKAIDDHDWILKHLEPLMSAGKKLAAEDPTLPVRDPKSYDPGYWTGLKLIALKYYIRPYLDILGQREKVAYVDLFAGPGLNRIGDRRVELPGSPLIPIMIHEEQPGRSFSLYVFSEQNPSYCHALGVRARRLCPEGARIEPPYEGDSNEYVSQLAGILRDNDIGHSLVFVDPEGLQWAWTSMERLIRTVPCDLIVNFPSSGFTRISTKTDLETRKTIARFLGMPVDDLPAVVDEDWAIQRYRTMLGSLGKDISTEIKITDYGAFHYHLIPAVRKTHAGSPWFRALRELKKRVDRLHGGLLGMVARQVDGVVGTLT